jgi:hypothetical protein
MSAAALPPQADVDREPVRGDRQPGHAGRPASRKWVASALSLVILAAVVAPVFENWKARPSDDFPLSYYPMFSLEKSDRQRLTYLVAHDAGGGRHLLPYRFAGQGGMNQVRRQINKRVDRGEASRLCRSVASRVARSGDLPKDLVNIQVVTGTFLMTDFFAGNSVPVSESVRAHCPVLGG